MDTNDNSKDTSNSYEDLNGLEQKLDALIVLGAGRFSWGNYSRVKQAANYNHGTPIILSGGRGLLCKGMKKTEAEKMKEVGIKMGIEDRVITLETKAKNTRENFSKSKAFLYLMPKIKNVGVVTNPAHMARALEYGRQELPEYNLIPVPVVPNKWDIKGLIANALCSIYEQFKVYRLAYRGDKKAVV